MGYYDNTRIGELNKKAEIKKEKEIKEQKITNSTKINESYTPTYPVYVFQIVMGILIIGVLSIGLFVPINVLFEENLTFDVINTKVFPILFGILGIIGVLIALITIVTYLDKYLQRKSKNK